MDKEFERVSRRQACVSVRAAVLIVVIVGKIGSDV